MTNVSRIQVQKLNFYILLFASFRASVTSAPATAYPSITENPYPWKQKSQNGDEETQETNDNKNIWKEAYKLPIRWMILKSDYMPQISEEDSTLSKFISKKQNVRQIRAVFQRAFTLWEQETQFRFVEVADESTAEIKISFGQSNHADCNFDFSGGELAHAFSPGPRGKDSISGNIHFWNKYKWVYGKVDRSNNERNIYVTAIHELGHALGLDHNNDNQSSIMYPIAISSWDWETETELPDCDKASIIDLYGPVPGFFQRPENIIVICFLGGTVVFIILWKSLSATEVIPKTAGWKSVKVKKEPKTFMGRISTMRQSISRFGDSNEGGGAARYTPPVNSRPSMASSGFSVGEQNPQPVYNVPVNKGRNPPPRPTKKPDAQPNKVSIGVNQFPNQHSRPIVNRPNFDRPEVPKTPPKLPAKNKTVGFNPGAMNNKLIPNSDIDNVTPSNAGAVFGVQLKSRK